MNARRSTTSARGAPSSVCQKTVGDERDLSPFGTSREAAADGVGTSDVHSARPAWSVNRAACAVVLDLRSKTHLACSWLRIAEEMIVNRSQLVNAVTESTHATRRTVEETVEILFETIIAEVRSGRKVTVVGFGTFSPTIRASRVGRNPRTGSVVPIPASRGVRFATGSAFKSALTPKEGVSMAVKKAAAKRTVRKAPAKKTAAKRTTAKKTVAKRTAAKKAVKKRAPPRRLRLARRRPRRPRPARPQPRRPRPRRRSRRGQPPRRLRPARPRPRRPPARKTAAKKTTAEEGGQEGPARKRLPRRLRPARPQPRRPPARKTAARKAVKRVARKATR